MCLGSGLRTPASGEERSPAALFAQGRTQAIVLGAPRVQFLFAPVMSVLLIFRRKGLGQIFYVEVAMPGLMLLLSRDGDTSSVAALLTEPL